MQSISLQPLLEHCESDLWLPCCLNLFFLHEQIFSPAQVERVKIRSDCQWFILFTECTEGGQEMFHENWWGKTQYRVFSVLKWKCCFSSDKNERQKQSCYLSTFNIWATGIALLRISPWNLYRVACPPFPSLLWERTVCSVGLSGSSIFITSCNLIIFLTRK